MTLSVVLADAGLVSQRPGVAFFLGPLGDNNVATHASASAGQREVSLCRNRRTPSGGKSAATTPAATRSKPFEGFVALFRFVCLLSA